MLSQSLIVNITTAKHYMKCNVRIAYPFTFLAQFEVNYFKPRLASFSYFSFKFNNAVS